MFPAAQGAKLFTEQIICKHSLAEATIDHTRAFIVVHHDATTSLFTYKYLLIKVEFQSHKKDEEISHWTK
jgi:hypothetical protein